MNSVNFNFYKDMYLAGYFSIDDLKEAIRFQLITVSEYEKICGQNFESDISHPTL